MRTSKGSMANYLRPRSWRLVSVKIQTPINYGSETFGLGCAGGRKARSIGGEILGRVDVYERVQLASGFGHV